jgi:sphinganine-1-phosphate aldolase
MMGTRSGAPMAAAWAVLQSVGEQGYLELTRRMLDARDRMVAAVRATPGLTVLVEPEAQIVCITAAPAAPRAIDVFALGAALHEIGGWYFDRQSPPDSLHATVCAANAVAIDAFVTDLATAVARVGATAAADRSTSYSTLE